MGVKKSAQFVFRKKLYGNAHTRAFYTLYGTVFREMLVVFNQFYTLRYPVRSFFRVLGLILSSVLRIFLGRSVKYSFAFTGEDRIIEGLLKPKIYETGSYVDVGCNHPIFLSNTYGLYRKGWRGICIDGNPALIKKYDYFRPKDIAVNALVSDKGGLHTFYISENDVLSTIEKTNLLHPDHKDLRHKTIECEARTLTSILNEHKFDLDFDVLSIDAEEHDFSVLKSLDFTKYRPKLIIVEDESFDFERIQENKINSCLTHHQYELKGYVLKNLYFMKKE